MGDVEIRMLGPGDEALVMGSPGAFDDPPDEAATATFLSDDRHLMAAAIDEGVVVGSVSAVMYAHPDKPSPELWLNEVGVAETHHRRGIAGRLMAAMLAEAGARGCVTGWVLMDRSNEAGLALYRKAGGKQVGGDHVMLEFDLQGSEGGT